MLLNGLIGAGIVLLFTAGVVLMLTGRRSHLPTVRFDHCSFEPYGVVTCTGTRPVREYEPFGDPMHPTGWRRFFIDANGHHIEMIEVGIRWVHSDEGTYLTWEAQDVKSYEAANTYEGAGDA